jgi:hypothetical protein
VETKPGTLEVVQDVAKNPENKNAKAALVYLLEKLLSDDSNLASDIACFWEEAEQTGNITKVIS